MSGQKAHCIMKKIPWFLLCLLALVANLNAGVVISTLPQNFTRTPGLEALGSVDLRTSGALAASTTTFGTWEKTYTALFPSGLKVDGAISFNPADDAVWVGYRDTRYRINGIITGDEPNAAVIYIHGDVELTIGGRQLFPGSYLIKNSDGSPIGKIEGLLNVSPSGDTSSGVGIGFFRTPAGMVDMPNLPDVPEPKGNTMLAIGLPCILLTLRRKTLV